MRDEVRPDSGSSAAPATSKRAKLRSKEDSSFFLPNPQQPTMPGLQSNSIPSPPPATLDASFSEVRTAKEVLKNSVVEEQASTRKISPQELKEHNTASEPWFVVNGEVYNGTAFLDDHPGGPDEIIGVAGEDATEAFMAIHPPVRRVYPSFSELC